MVNFTYEMMVSKIMHVATTNKKKNHFHLLTYYLRFHPLLFDLLLLFIDQYLSYYEISHS